MSYHLTHPESGQEIEVRAEQVPTYESQGWRTKPQAKPVEKAHEPKSE